ncbi:MAG: anthranilate synthase component I family protein [Chlamydiota bacterium]|nr:anthranilate synthase component I family protein [Chlamydiota bacterium]
MFDQYTLKKKFSLEEFLTVARLFSKDSGTTLLLSGSTHDSAEKSFLCIFPFESVSIKSGNVYLKKGVEERTKQLQGENPWSILKKYIHSIDQQHSLPEWVGFLAYEMGAYHDEDVVVSHYNNSYPNVYFQRCAIVLQLEHSTRQLTIHMNREGIDSLEERQREWAQNFVSGKVWELDLEKLLDPFSKVDLTIESSLDDISRYEEKILKAKEYIFAGDIYQVNISQECSYKGHFDPFQIFLSLYEKNPAPFSAFMKLEYGHTIVSSSPERLLKKTGCVLETRPIKGTIPRGRTAEEDIKNKEILLSSEKDKSELLMITDLMRNDLGKVSVSGSVITKKIWHCEGYTNVYHLLSIICSKVEREKHPVEILRAVFPGGSITGCPKIRSMEIISEIEQQPRGIYTGSIGYIAGNGDFDFNIMIRTLDILNDVIKLRLGGAIVADSDVDSEYQETLQKGESIFQCL